MLIEQIRKDRMIAYKAKDNIKKDVLGCLISESCKDEILDPVTGEKTNPDDKKVLSVIKKFIEGAEEIKSKVDEKEYEFYKANMEIEILSSYRPTQLTDDEVKTEIINFISNNPEFKLGDIMSHFKINFENRYNARTASTITKEYLTNGV